MDHRTRWAKVAVLLALVVSMAGAAEPPQVKMRLQRVALFKNGLAMFTADVALPEKGTTFAFRPPVAAAHGSFWVSADPQVKFTSLVASKVWVDTQRRAASVAEFLAANVGRQVTLQMGEAAGGPVEGTLVDAGLSAPRTHPTDPYRPGGLVGASSYPRPGQFALIHTKSGYVAVNPQSVARVEVGQAEPGRDYTVQEQAVELRGSLAQPAPGKGLTVSWLGKGATWAPSYRVDITDPKQARFSAKAVVINEAADLSGVDVALVTGVPHLQLADVVSPLAMKQSMASFLRSLIKGSSASDRQSFSTFVGQVGGGYTQRRPRPRCRAST